MYLFDESWLHYTTYNDWPRYCYYRNHFKKYIEKENLDMINDFINSSEAKKEKKYTYPTPKKVFADVDAGVTVVIWDDGEKTIVRASADETPDIYDAFCAAFCKRIYGTNSALKRELNKILVVKGEQYGK